MSETKIPGIKSLHRIVTKNCRKRAYLAWLKDVNEAVESELLKLDAAWDDDSDVKFNIVITVEYDRDGS